MSKDDCNALFHALTNKDRLPTTCKEFFHSETEVFENHSLNVKGGFRPKNGISHAALQRRMTGKMSGHSTH